MAHAVRRVGSKSQEAEQICISARLRELKMIWILNCKFNDVESGIANSAQQGHVSETRDRSSPVPTGCPFYDNIGRSSPAETWTGNLINGEVKVRVFYWIFRLSLAGPYSSLLFFLPGFITNLLPVMIFQFFLFSFFQLFKVFKNEHDFIVMVGQPGFKLLELQQ